MTAAWIRGLILAALCGAFGLGVWHLAAAEPVKAPAPIRTQTSTSIGECTVCHSWNGKVEADSPLRRYFKCGSRDFIALNESIVWEQKDPHSKAYAVLQTETAKEMGRKLGGIDVTTAAQCLTCHAIDLEPKSKNKPLEQFVRGADLGIGCTACHGLEKTWQTEHFTIKETPEKSVVEWREKSAEHKTAAGLTDLRHPETKAKLCASCHIGSVEEQKIITHEMYAAGHPPLPPLELMSFLEDEPRHWKLPKEIAYFNSLDSASLEKRFHVKKDDDFQARHFLVGAVVALQTEADLLVHEASRAPGKDHAGLDYARFDCYACHHDLKLPSDRQKRGYPGAPGRPPLKAWNGAFALAVAEYIGAEEKVKFEGHWKQAQTAAYDRPYGDPVKMIEAAKIIKGWCATTLQTLNSQTISPEQATKLQAILFKLVNEDQTLADPEAAMALVWAYKALTKANPEDPEWRKVTVLPTSPQDGVDKNRMKPVTSGELLTDRLDRFNKFTIAEFRKQKLPPAK